MSPEDWQACSAGSAAIRSDLAIGGVEGRGEGLGDRGWLSSGTLSGAEDVGTRQLIMSKPPVQRTRVPGPARKGPCHQRQKLETDGIAGVRGGWRLPLSGGVDRMCSLLPWPQPCHLSAVVQEGSASHYPENMQEPSSEPPTHPVGTQPT